MKKIFSKIFWSLNLGPWYYQFLKKNKARKSHATVPLEPITFKAF